MITTNKILSAADYWVSFNNQSHIPNKKNKKNFWAYVKKTHKKTLKQKYPKKTQQEETPRS